MTRSAQINRETAETRIALNLDLDGTGVARVSTGVGFLDHMLTLFAAHGLVDLEVDASGDLEVDQHHTVEDVGICLGLALANALGSKAGIVRYGSMTLPMDETLVTVALDFSGRPAFSYRVEYATEKIGDFDVQLVQEFWQGVVNNARMNLHMLLHHGSNSHHIAEALFKAAARSVRQAAAVDPRQKGIPSSKQSLD